jgi:hypothetical protein
MQFIRLSIWECGHIVAWACWWMTCSNSVICCLYFSSRWGQSLTVMLAEFITNSYLSLHSCRLRCNLSFYSSFLRRLISASWYLTRILLDCSRSALDRTSSACMAEFWVTILLFISERNSSVCFLHSLILSIFKFSYSLARSSVEGERSQYYY